MPTPIQHPEQHETLGHLKKIQYERNWPTRVLSEDIHRVTGQWISTSTLDRISHRGQCYPRIFHHLEAYVLAPEQQATLATMRARYQQLQQRVAP